VVVNALAALAQESNAATAMLTRALESIATLPVATVLGETLTGRSIATVIPAAQLLVAASQIAPHPMTTDTATLSAIVPPGLFLNVVALRKFKVAFTWMEFRVVLEITTNTLHVPLPITTTSTTTTTIMERPLTRVLVLLTRPLIPASA
jgi:hypothetical protein